MGHRHAGRHSWSRSAERGRPTDSRAQRWWLTSVLGALLLPAATLPAATLQEAQERQAEAETARAALLAPSSYLRGTRAMERAAQSDDAEARQQDLEAAATAFDAALEGAAAARATLGETLASRDAANRAEAFRLATADWARAEDSLHDAVRALERGKTPGARKRGAQATELYRAAELTAIKARYLTAARNAILEAERVKADRLAPRSFARANELLAEAEAALERDRLTTAGPGAMAADAAYQARLAVYIAAQVERVRAKEASIEDLILENQAVLTRLAATAGTSADLSAGPAVAEAALRDELQRLAVLETELDQSRRQRAGLEEEIRELDERLGDTSAERRDLMRRLEANARVREQFDQVETLFQPEEAVVLRDGDKLIVRMVGLRFPSGSAHLDDGARSLLDRLETAFNVFPRCEVRVEGHTDSSGGAKQNQALSQARATAVADYLVESTGVQAFRVQAAGYGDSRPINSNRTAEGRAQNRRIDVVIIPRLNEDG